MTVLYFFVRKHNTSENTDLFNTLQLENAHAQRKIDSALPVSLSFCLAKGDIPGYAALLISTEEKLGLLALCCL